MKKKLLSLALVMCCCLTLSACSSNKATDDADQKANDSSLSDASSTNSGPDMNTEEESNATQENNDAPVLGKEVPPTEEEEPQTARQEPITTPEGETDFSGKVDVTAAAERETPKDPAQTATQSTSSSSAPPENRAKQREDGVYDENDNNIADAMDPDSMPTQEEIDADRVLAKQNLIDLIKAGENPYDYGYVFYAYDTHRELTKEDYVNFLKAGKDPLVDDYLDSEHEQGLY